MFRQYRRSVRSTLMASVAMFAAAPAMAQEAQTAPAAVSPPPVVTTSPAPVTPPTVTRTVTPTVATSAPSGPAPATDGGSPTKVNPEAAAQAAAEDAERRPAPPAEARRATPVRAAAAPPPAAEAAAPVPQAATAPAAAVAPQARPDPGEPNAAPAEAKTETTQTTAEPGAPMWPLALIAALIVAAGAFFYLRRRREPVYEEYVEEPAYVEPVATVDAAEHSTPAAAVAAAGLMVDDRNGIREETGREEVGREEMGVADAVIADRAAPVVAEGTSLEAASREDVAALTAVNAPADRPWLEFGFRPVRAGANVDEALVEVELTVANAGNVSAEDVRISTFMLPAGNDSDMERLLIENHDDTAAAVTIPAGEGTRIDATLATPRAALVNGADHAAFKPVIVADARYRLPDGGEGRTSASFVVGATSDGGATLEPLSLDRPVIREDVAAHLYREPERV